MLILFRVQHPHLFFWFFLFFFLVFCFSHGGVGIHPVFVGHVPIAFLMHLIYL